MKCLNKVILLGRFTKNTEVRQVNDTYVAKNSLALNHKFGDKEEVIFVDIEAWGRLAEIIGEYGVKGAAALVEGMLKINRWEDKGEKKERMFVRVDNFILLPHSKREDDPSEAVADTEPLTEEDIPF